MTPIRIFISSVQKEFAAERAALRDYLRGDALMRRFFEPFQFEDVPAADRRADEVYLDEVEACDLYLGLFGDDYGYEDADGLSPTEREFELATTLHKPRLIFVKGEKDNTKHPKMQALIRRAGGELIRRRFVSGSELVAAVYAALVQVLEARELIRTGPFDGAVCPNATIADLDEEKMRRFIREARRAPYQVYRGTSFDVVDQAVDFVLSKINLAVGTRAASTQAPVTYEIPPEVVREAIVNAVAHRDYTSHGSVQVMLFADRLEVWNPGTLPPSLTLAMLREPHGSVPANPLLAEPMYLVKYIERMGTGIRDMIRRCREAGLPEPTFAVTDGFVATVWRRPGEVTGEVAGEVAGEVTGEVAKLLLICHGEMSRKALRESLHLKGDDNFRRLYLVPALDAGLLEMTIPDKATSRFQKYRLTEAGRALLRRLQGGGRIP